MMNLPYELFIALRYLQAKRKQAFISLISLISVLGVGLGVSALIIVLAVMSGFEKDLRTKILGTTSHIVVMNYEATGIQNYKELTERLASFPEITGASPFLFGQVMIDSKEGSPKGVAVRGIDVESIEKVSDLPKNIEQGSLKDLAGNTNVEDGVAEDLDGILLGNELADRLMVFVGDTVSLLSPSAKILTPVGVMAKTRSFKVVGIFSCGMYEYDANLVYLSLPVAQRFFNLDDVASGVETKIKDIFKADKIAQKIQDQLGFPYYCRDWTQMNRNLFEALKLEKLAMFIILVLIIVVAAFNIISTLIMMVMEKNRDIAILKSMGATNRQIMNTFIYQGMIIGLFGTIFGDLLGFIICWIADTYKLIRLAGDVYYLSYLPFVMSWQDFITVTVVSLLISFLSTIYPSYRAARLDPVEAIRYE